MIKKMTEKNKHTIQEEKAMKNMQNYFSDVF